MGVTMTAKRILEWSSAGLLSMGIVGIFLSGFFFYLGVTTEVYLCDAAAVLFIVFGWSVSKAAGNVSDG